MASPHTSTQSTPIFETLFEYSPDAIVVVGADGRIFRASHQVQKMFGYSREEVIGQPVEMLVPERFRARHPELRNAFFAAPRTRPAYFG